MYRNINMKKFLLFVVVFYFSSGIFASSHGLNFEEVAPGIFVHQGEHLDVDETYHGDIANIGFIIGEDAIAVIDTGGSLKIGRELELAIKKISNLPIRYVINTHVHLDHIYGNAAFISENPIFVGHSELPKAMLLRKEFYEITNQNFLNIPPEESIQIPPSLLISVNKPQEIDLGNRKLRLEAFPYVLTSRCRCETRAVCLIELFFSVLCVSGTSF